MYKIMDNSNKIHSLTLVVLKMDIEIIELTDHGMALLGPNS